MTAASAANGIPSTVSTVIALIIFVATLALIMLRSKRINEAFAALGGATAMLLAGIVSPLQALKTLLGDWNIFLFFLGMMTLSTLVECAGVFDWLAARAAVLAYGSTRCLYLNMQDIRIVLLYVVDSGPGHDLERLRQRYVGMGERGARLLAEMMQAEQEQGNEVLAEAQTALIERWPCGAPGPDQIKA